MRRNICCYFAMIALLVILGCDPSSDTTEAIGSADAIVADPNAKMIVVIHFDEYSRPEFLQFKSGDQVTTVLEGTDKLTAADR